MTGRIATAALGSLVLSAAAGGCGDASAREYVVLDLDDLPPSAGLDPTGEGWQSVGWEGDWHAYPGGVTLEVTHGLGRVPTAVLVYVAFDPDGRGAGLAAGDLARIVDVTETMVVVHNGTDADMFCRIALR